MDLGLKDKRAIVTGGSLGIGKAIARELAREGVDVALVARTKDRLEAAARELATETGRRVIALVADVTSRAQVDAMVARAAEALGGRRDGAVVHFEPRPTWAPAIAAIEQAGARVKRLGARRADLETVFLTLTGRGLRDA